MFPRNLSGPLAQTDRRRLPRNHPLPACYRLLPEDVKQKIPVGEFARDPFLAAVEAALFLADEPLTLKKVAQAAAIQSNAEARKLIVRLRELYEKEGSAFQVEEIAGGYQLMTRVEFHPWVSRLRRTTTDLRLSGAARETLAIIAYKQPITRADIEVVRGVQVSEVLRQLMEKGLVRITGRDDSLGRPVLYGTTKKFLQVYGLKSIHDLPERKPEG